MNIWRNYLIIIIINYPYYKFIVHIQPLSYDRPYSVNSGPVDNSRPFVPMGPWGKTS